MPSGTGVAEKRIGARPSLADSRDALNDLLRKIQFSACAINDGYLHALGLSAGNSK
jgi:hypothetical protein